MLRGMFKRLISARPKYAAERMRLRTAISNGEVDPRQPFSARAMYKILKWDSFFDGGDWIELEMEAEERKILVKSVGDFLQLLDAIDDAKFES